MQYPFVKTWWIAENQLLGGQYPGTPNPDDQETMLAALLEMGITCFISLQEEQETGSGSKPFPDYMPKVRALARERGVEVGFSRFPIRDQSAAFAETLIPVLDHIDERIEAGRKVYLHCWGGNGRTGTVAGCWLVRHGLTAEQAFEAMAHARQGRQFRYPAPENNAQRAVVRHWHEHDPRLKDG
ncbi:MAG: dual specificity protein phosphatase family protein [Phycisphaeraceae bacterium]|nr:dual specificity protein phosphatase family protein [Phycisphaeraceae bacterium]